jgi:hypothetical protein
MQMGVPPDLQEYWVKESLTLLSKLSLTLILKSQELDKVKDSLFYTRHPRNDPSICFISLSGPATL